MKLIVNENSGAALNATLLYEYLNKKLNQPAKLSMAKGEKLCLEVDGNNNKLESIQSISRHLATSLDKTLTGSNALELAEVDSWLDFAQALVNSKTEAAFNELAKIMETALTNKQYLVGNRLTIADISILSSLKFNNDLYQKYLAVNKNNLIRYSAGMEKALQNVSANKVKSSEPKDYSKEGKFIDLPDAVKGKVVVRFPPEASGFLHIGHAKAALLNQFYQLEFEGKLIFRFDDTNPAKENALYEKVIEEDVKLLGITWDQFSRTSDYFDLLSDYCEQMIREGKAYVDDTEAALMKEEREQKKDSVNRANSIEKNLKIWEEMKKGTENGLRYCVRAMLNMQSPNGTMRDPTIYRCKAEPHLVTGDKYKVYPTYDFACPIVDSIENVTHALRTTEYHDRDEQYYWMCDALNLRKPFIYEYSRFNLTNTVLSKRRLTWFVDTKRVTGWDDPRFPTVRGILRRGMSVEALKQFIIAQGSSRSVVVMEWDKIWAINKKVIDEVAPRHTALLKENRVLVNVKGQNSEEVKDMPRHPKNAKLGTKKVCYSSKIMIDEADALTVKENDTVTFMDWGNMKIKKINKSGDKITSIDAELDLDNKDYKKTLKLTWLACAPTMAPFTPVRCIHYDHIIAKAILDKDEDFKNYCEHQTEFPFDVLGDHEMRNLKKGDTIQVSRRGYYICDKAFTPAVAGKETSKDGVWEGEACVLLYIPEGNKTENPTTYMSISKQVYPSVKFALENAKTKEKTPTPAVQVGAVSSQSGDLDAKITKQGDLIRDLKAKKASKDDITKEVQTLLALKTEYKTLTGQEWKPSAAAPAPAAAAPASSSPNAALDAKITKQGDLIRELKAKKASKDDITKEVQTLLALKAEFKTLTGQEWKPSAAPAATPAPVAKKPAASSPGDDLSARITKQGDLVRDLKAKKASKDEVTKEVQTLLGLKSEYKTLTGQEWKPSAAAPAPAAATPTPAVADSPSAALDAKITKQGDLIRELKAKKASKDDITKEVQTLLALKAEFKTLTGQEWKPSAAPAGSSAPAPAAPRAEKPKKEKVPQPVKDDGKKQTRLGLEAKKEENLPEWYTQIITKGDLIEYYDVSGCYILRPWSYFIWDQIKDFFDKRIKAMGVHNCYFPIFVSKAALEREKDHIADFAPEVAWVTKSGQSDLAEPIAIRPTSETVMYPSYARWIQSHRDLPMKMNQWNNVVRWEFKHPQPFLRTREFLWQEGHTAFATREEATEEVYEILDHYADIYSELLAVPVVKGQKTEKEKFAGADFTTTVEAFIAASGRAIQGGTSHHLGQNFSKMFNIEFADPVTNEKSWVHQNSWGLTTRTIGVLVMVHSDNIGLVLPPKVALYQVVIVPCGVTASLSKEDEEKLYEKCKEYEKTLKKAGIRAHYDNRHNYSPGWKFNSWELKGVPIRIELGPKDIAANKYCAVRRDLMKKEFYEEAGLVATTEKMMVDMHADMLKKAEAELESNIAVVDTWTEFLKNLDAKKIIMVPFCLGKDCEEVVKKDSARDAVVEEGAPSMGAKSLCIPFKQPREITTQKCFNPSCGKPAQKYTLFGRSY